MWHFNSPNFWCLMVPMPLYCQYHFSERFLCSLCIGRVGSVYYIRNLDSLFRPWYGINWLDCFPLISLILDKLVVHGCPLCKSCVGRHFLFTNHCPYSLKKCLWGWDSISHHALIYIVFNHGATLPLNISIKDEKLRLIGLFILIDLVNIKWKTMVSFCCTSMSGRQISSMSRKLLVDWQKEILSSI